MFTWYNVEKGGGKMNVLKYLIQSALRFVLGLIIAFGVAGVTYLSIVKWDKL